MSEANAEGGLAPPAEENRRRCIFSHRRSRFSWLVLFFCLGIVAARLIGMPFLLIYGAAGIFFLACLLTFKRMVVFGIIIAGLSFTLGAALLKNYQVLPGCHILGQLGYRQGEIVSMEGVVRSQPEYRFKNTSFIMEARAIRMPNFSSGCCGKILVKIDGSKDLYYGQPISASGTLLRAFGNFGSNKKTSYRDYLTRQGIYLLMRIPSPYLVKTLGKGAGFSIKALALGLKNALESVIFKYLSPVTASIIDAMMLGERRGIPPLVNMAMMQTGTVHILVVSGFNMGLVIFVVMLMLKIIRLPRKARLIIALPVITLYCLATGASAPVVRATVMAAVYLCAYALKREAHIYNSCAIALIFILACNPLQLFDIGLQLSFASVLALAGLYPKIKALLKADRVKNAFFRFVIDGALVSFSCWVGTMGIIAYYFGFFSPITVLANLFIVPLATLITFSGFVLVFLAVAAPFLAPYIATSCEFLVALLIKVNHLLLQIPFSHFRFS